MCLLSVCLIVPVLQSEHLNGEQPSSLPTSLKLHQSSDNRMPGLFHLELQRQHICGPRVRPFGVPLILYKDPGIWALVLRIVSRQYPTEHLYHIHLAIYSI